ncbi:bifunctional demethylmenaquinone methyltransferase/2-methoxy-6-polyprenyl-1,4-benzoquinol methylase UbiE [Chloroflexus sp.]|uniref:bifunctional demethylmenaquinone methyltransferase/2-methoxy-6-polyprenyl-1,4-benzoquinol methylase UbiE n=1 Tax=Chloroflexus sp. TaxID=1904827 RepID=UPI0026281168|nr:bifunctional demethylmenaquinone methyltransferase/2-methoxy-6-polyprenyl-1,4-benzoquinol methylase UbiE [uncultured Chloroflexus sp.]
MAEERTITNVLPPPEEKAAYVERMFARIARGYDRVNRVMTFGLDQTWRRKVVEAVAPPINGRALDVGTGTGDFLPELAVWMRNGIVIGVDFTVPMMRAGQSKIADLTASGRGMFVAGDALQLPFPDNTFDSITTGFVLRNVTDIPTALREMYRVARPGAMMACLEVARPRNPLIRWGHRLYFEQIVPWIGALLGGDRRAYTYLPQSARAFPPPDELAAMMRAAGWQHVSYRLYGLGAVAIHVGAKV